MATTLGNINLYVQDVARATAFYTQAVGLTENTERSAPPHFALLQAGEATITLQDGAAPGAVLGQSASVELGFTVADLEEARARLIEAGGQVSDLQQMGWGGGFDARDLDGHRLTFYQMRGNK